MTEVLEYMANDDAGLCIVVDCTHFGLHCRGHDIFQEFIFYGEWVVDWCLKLVQRLLFEVVMIHCSAFCYSLASVSRIRINMQQHVASITRTSGNVATWSKIILIFFKTLVVGRACCVDMEDNAGKIVASIALP